VRTNNANSWGVNSAAAVKTVCEEFSSEKLIFSKLYAENGPLVQVDKVWPLLGFNSRDTFNRAAQKKRIPIRVIRPEGRRKSFVATDELSKYLATLTQSVKGEIPT
jgi:hypothetical protein